MLHIYVRLGYTLDVWAAGSGSFMWFPVPEKRFCGTYWLYMITVVMKLFRRNCGLRNFSHHILASAWSKHWRWCLSNTKSINNPLHLWQLPWVWTQNKLKHGLLLLKLHLSVIFQRLKEGNPHDMVSCSFVWFRCLESFLDALDAVSCAVLTFVKKPPWLLTLKASFRLFIFSKKKKKKVLCSMCNGCITYLVRQTNAPLSPVKQHTCTHDVLGMHMRCKKQRFCGAGGIS